METGFEPNWPLYLMLAATIVIFGFLPKLAHIVHPKDSSKKSQD